ncbi:MAG TPA: hypothetical protein VMU61_16020 [Candidatus Aquilonibacter sp.]|nr:hypothetical protein [Candidatus Aquilonibacter sp.]
MKHAFQARQVDFGILGEGMIALDSKSAGSQQQENDDRFVFFVADFRSAQFANRRSSIL